MSAIRADSSSSHRVITSDTVADETVRQRQDVVRDTYRAAELARDEELQDVAGHGASWFVGVSLERFEVHDEIGDVPVAVALQPMGRGSRFLVAQPQHHRRPGE